MSEPADNNIDGRKFIVSQAIMFSNGAATVVPMRTFDNKEEAEAWASEREKFIKTIPQNLMGFLRTLEIAGLGVVVSDVASPNPERKIVLATPRMPGLLMR